MQVKGKIDRKSGRKKIYGYVLDIHSSSSLKCILYIDNESFKVDCNLHNEHLEKKYGHGNHGFVFIIPEKFKDKDIHHIKLTTSQNDLIDEMLVPLPNFTLLNYHEQVCGYLSDDVVNDIHNISGVLINKKEKNDTRTAIIKLNDTLIEVEASKSRKESVLFPSYKNSGFTISLTDEQLMALDNFIEISLIDKETNALIDKKEVANPSSNLLLSNTERDIEANPDALIKLASKNTKSGDVQLASILYKIHEKDISEFKRVVSSILDVANSPFVRLYGKYCLNKIEINDTDCAQYQLDLFQDFLLARKDFVTLFPFFRNHFPKLVTNDFILKAYNDGMDRGLFTFCLYLIENYSHCFVDKNDPINCKIQIYKKMKAHHLVVDTITEFKKSTGNTKYDFELINQLMKLHEYDKAYSALMSKRDELEKSKKQDHRFHLRFSDYLFIKGKYVQALEEAEKGLAIKPENKELLENQVKLLSTLGKSVESCSAAEKLCDLYPSQIHTDMKNMLRIEDELKTKNNCAWYIDLRAENNPDEAISLVDQFVGKFNRGTPFSVIKLLFVCSNEPTYKIPGSIINTEYVKVFSSSDEILYIKKLCAEQNVDWVGYVKPAKNLPEIFNEELSFFESVGMREGAICSNVLSLCRKEVLADYVNWYDKNYNISKVSEVIDGFKGVVFTTGEKSDRSYNSRKKIVFITPRGISNFGGGEQFLEGMSSCYENNFSHEIFVIALSDQFKNSCKYLNNTFFVTDKDKHRIREILFELNPDVIWSLTDDDMTPYFEPLRYLRSQSIIGLHYYRAFMITASDGEFYCDNRNIIRNSFKNILASVDTVYANSIWTQRLILNHFNVALPIIFSLPHKYPLNKVPNDGRKYVLSVNTEFKKGFAFIVEIAKKLPNIQFVALSNQSNSEVAKKYCKDNGVNNIEILPFQEKMQDLYSQSKVVLVPSFDFLETFSRVPIESQCFGVPVIGSNAGNIPYILEKSGICMAKNADDWANEIQRLFSDNSYYEHRVEMAFENARDRYNFSRQPPRLAQLSAYCRKRCLVAVGSGVGNMILGSVIVKKLSDYYNVPVDIVIDGVPKNSAMVFANSPYVNAVYYGNQLVKRRRYDIVFITRCYPRELSYSDFNAHRIFRSRDIVDYMDMRGLQEQEAELKCLEFWLGIPYKDDDNFAYTVKCNPFPLDVNPKRIGIHVGCKPGYWTKKQWPYFKELIVKLQSAGYEVASLGVPNEYVEGTINGTSYETWDMVNQIQQCTFVVANDSGIAHLAKALGKHGVVIFGPTYSAKLLPYSKDWKVLHADDVPCSPCFMLPDFEKCECDKSCMTHISAEEVFNVVVQEINKFKEEK